MEKPTIIIEWPSLQIDPGLKRLLACIPRTLEAIAPEKAPYLGPHADGLRVRLLPQRDVVASYSPETCTIQISFALAQIYWASTYAYVAVYKQLEGHGPHDRFVDLRATAESRDATDVLSWAMTGFVRNSLTAQPDHLPRPQAKSEEHTLSHWADELSLTALAHIMHHELAHRRLRHDPDNRSIDQERDADASAAQWILDGVPPSDNRFLKRILGIATSLAITTARGIHTRDYGGRTHPRSFDRLVNMLNQYLASEPDNIVWAFVISILSLHAHAAGLPIPNKPCETFRDAVDAIVDVLASQPVNSP